MDPLFTAITDKTRPVADRADDLQALHEMLNAHLDEEEREAVPLIEAHITAAKWDADGKKVKPRWTRRSCRSSSAGCARRRRRTSRLLRCRRVPMGARFQLKRVCGPANAKRFAALYGGQPAVLEPVA